MDGSALSALLLADGLRESEWETHVAFGFEGPIIPQYRESGHKTHVIHHDNWLRRRHPLRFVRDVIAEWSAARRFEALIDAINPDLVYMNTIVSLAGAVAARRRQVPCIWHIRELFSSVGGEMHAPSWARPLIPLVLRHYASEIVVNSKAVARDVLGVGSEEDTIVISNAASKKFFDNLTEPLEARKQFGLPSEASVIGVPGTLRPIKGHDFFFRAVAPLLRERDEIVVPVTGNDQSAYAATLKTMAENIGVEGQVWFLGRVTNMPAFYRACDVVCVPSQSETFGRTVIEAFASGTPVVATAVGGMKEVIDSGETGLLVPYNDDDALASSIVRLLENSQLRQEISAKARQVAEEEYHEAVYKQRTGQVIYEVLGSCH